jgi:pectate lyase
MHWKVSILFLCVSSVASQNTTCKRCEDVAHGFASLNGGTTGGKGGRIVFANTWQELKSYASQNGSLIVRVSGLLRADDHGFEIPIASDKTIIGVGKRSGVVGGGFAIKGTKNIILRNLQVSDTRIAEDWPGKTEDWDGIQVDTGSNIWIDHMKVLARRAHDGTTQIELSNLSSSRE